jgi:hypothetical protein
MAAWNMLWHIQDFRCPGRCPVHPACNLPSSAYRPKGELAKQALLPDGSVRLGVRSWSEHSYQRPEQQHPSWAAAWAERHGLLKGWGGREAQLSRQWGLTQQEGLKLRA